MFKFLKNVKENLEIESSLRRAPALEDVEDPRDFIDGDILKDGDINLPEDFELADHHSRITNQGSRGICVSEGHIGIAEYAENKERVTKDRLRGVELSREFLFKKIKEFDKKDYGYEGYGAYLRSGAKAIKKYGSCFESTLPYSPNEPEDFWKQVSISPKMLEEAINFRMANYMTVRRTETDIKRAIIQTGLPISAGIPIYSNYRVAKKNGGIFPDPAGERIGGHAVCFVGWYGEYLKFKNSWGDQWGDGGFCYWPISSLHKLYSIWSFVDWTNPQVNKEKLIEANMKLLPDWEGAKEIWLNGLNKGIMTEHSKPNEAVTNLAYLYFLKRQGKL